MEKCHVCLSARAEEGSPSTCRRQTGFFTHMTYLSSPPASPHLVQDMSRSVTLMARGGDGDKGFGGRGCFSSCGTLDVYLYIHIHFKDVCFGEWSGRPMLRACWFHHMPPWLSPDTSSEVSSSGMAGATEARG